MMVMSNRVRGKRVQGVVVMRGSKTRESGALQLGVRGAKWERGLAERSDTRLWTII